MTYNYTKSLTQLKTFYLSMQSLNISIGTFNHSFNGVDSSVIFDTRNFDTGWRLIFIKINIGTILEIPIHKGFYFSIESSEDYLRFIKYFNISGKKGCFSISDFISNLQNQIPAAYKLSDHNRHVVLSYDKIDNETEGIYPIGTINWEIVHAKNPKLSPYKYHRQEGNLLKTKELYPEIYKKIIDMDISIKYGINKTDQTEPIKKGHL